MSNNDNVIYESNDSIVYESNEEINKQNKEKQKHFSDNYTKLWLNNLWLVIFLHVAAVGISLPSLGKVALSLFDDDSSKAGAFIAMMSALQSLLGFFANPLFGNCSDRYGRKPFILMSEISLVCMGILLSINISVYTVFMASILYGSFGVITTISHAIVVDITPQFKDLAPNFGFLGSAFGAGFIVGVGIGALVGGLSGNLNLPFICMTIFESAITIPLTWIKLQESLNVYYDTETQQYLQDQKFTNIWRNMKLLASTNRLKYLALTTFLVFAASSVVSVFLVYTEERYNWNVAQNGIFMLSFGLCVIISQVWGIKLMLQYFHSNSTLKISSYVLGVCFFLWGFSYYGWMMFIVLILAIPGLPLAVLLSGEISKEITPELQGRLHGGVQSLRVISKLIGSVTMGLSFSYFVSSRAPFYLPGAPFLLSAFYMLIASCTLSYALQYEACTELSHIGSRSSISKNVIYDQSASTSPTSSINLSNVNLNNK